MFEHGDGEASHRRARPLSDAPARSVLELAFAHLMATMVEVTVDTLGASRCGGSAGEVPTAAPRRHVGKATTTTTTTPHVPGSTGDPLARPEKSDGADGVGVEPRPSVEPTTEQGKAIGPAAVPELARALAGLDLAGAGDDVLVDAVVAWQRVASWVAAGQARVVAEMLARGTSSVVADQVVHELSAALTTSRHAAGVLVGRAAGLDASPRVADALAAGRIDAARADVLVGYHVVPVEVRRRVADQLVGTADAPGEASGLTPAQLRDRLRRAAIADDPDGATDRARRAGAERHVWLDPAPDQMAWLTALLPATDAARVWARVEDCARQVVRAPGEDRTLAQARADVLTDLITGTAPTLTPAGGVATPAGAAAETADAAAAGAGAWRAGRGPVRTVVNVTVPASTLLGTDEAPGDLAGFGPIPAPLARTLAGDPGATWRRIVTDPVTGAATDVSRRGYAPGPVLGDLVRARDVSCTFPGCRVPAARCDLDHIDPFDPARPTTGQTRAGNLHPVCRAHHNAKTHGGWTTHRAVDGAITWTAPSGHAYTVPATPTDPAVPAPPARHRPPPHTHDDGPPPF